ncbi:MAG: AI-2E family transporter [Roseburia sp.]|nr:AI-2E family transporter [Roseburia sp.]
MLERDKMRQLRGLLVFGAILILLLMYSKEVFQGIGLAFGIAKPFLYGGVVAFILNLPMKAIENTFFGKRKGKLADKYGRPISLLLAILIVGIVVALVIGTMVPQLTKAVSVLGQKLPAFLDETAVRLQELSARYPELEKSVAALENLELNWDSIVATVTEFLKNGLGSMLTSTVNVASSIVGGVVNGTISFIFALYILAQKEKLADQGKRILTAYLPDKVNRRVLYVMSLLHRNFSNFITGQCLEAVILGCMFVIAMSIFRMPYAVMVGVLIAFTALIPIVGAFIGCVVGAFLIMIENPVLAVWFVVLFLVLQQLEGNLIYPRVVGNSVGLPSIWVLAAVSLGGSLFGIAGMLLFIPLLATGYSLLRDSVNDRNAKKGPEFSAAGRKEPAVSGRAEKKPENKPENKTEKQPEKRLESKREIKRK